MASEKSFVPDIAGQQIIFRGDAIRQATPNALFHSVTSKRDPNEKKHVN